MRHYYIDEIIIADDFVVTKCSDYLITNRRELMDSEISDLLQEVVKGYTGKDDS